MNKAFYLPKGYNSVIPALAFHGAGEAIKWYTNVFGAKEKMRFNNPDGTIAHAEITIGDNVIMLAEENPEFNHSPRTLKGNSVNLFIYVPDVDATIKKALNNRANLVKPAEDQFYGDRTGRIEDPFGYLWIVSTHVKDVSEKEMKKVMDEMAHEHA